jgi:2'-5' RNA ligase
LPGASQDAAEPAWAARLREPGRRLFVAVPLPVEAAARIAALVEGVRATDGAAIVGPIVGPVGQASRGGRDVRWVRLDSLHLTLRFLGPTLEPRVAGVEEAVRRVAAGGHPFDIGLVGAGAFPHPDRPRALWLGIGAGGTELAELATGLDDELGARGWPNDERPFRPHLTLARSDGVRAGPRLARRLIQAADGFSVRWRAGSIVLFESLTGNGPARYVPLVEAPLGGSAGGADSGSAGGADSGSAEIGGSAGRAETAEIGGSAGGGGSVEAVGEGVRGGTLHADGMAPTQQVPVQGDRRSS